ncbi:hypothetical protein TVAG_109560 [Trichomonas vaginalis G3]|uniref:Uncharacterized protein n=1 Tax=Trichomonas vaginalis (strain ATCC PRA-98 / G3) TaxID=412133 RepID=A2EAE5_TRIV3|nr:hypothetical protein TVAGG3_0924250 [Trichomonas vaginalis G3]EAY10372.1 hypothetical protein TVAG_109560 [Trichomonas vaginalis G3]KAI5485345.1 hypothetical protein TVAGG3_0924250 [Trichomonas vaginalis G3]|eukprot:XP_001322595.1 hypothetical protein [Trichomonas vaginalis G3]
MTLKQSADAAERARREREREMRERQKERLEEEKQRKKEIAERTKLEQEILKEKREKQKEISKDRAREEKEKEKERKRQEREEEQKKRAEELEKIKATIPVEELELLYPQKQPKIREAPPERFLCPNPGVQLVPKKARRTDASFKFEDFVEFVKPLRTYVGNTVFNGFLTAVGVCVFIFFVILMEC